MDPTVDLRLKTARAQLEVWEEVVRERRQALTGAKHPVVKHELERQVRRAEMHVEEYRNGYIPRLLLESRQPLSDISR